MFPNIAQVNMDNLVLLYDRSICIIAFSLLIRIVLWGAVAQRLERATDNRVLTGSNPTETVLNKPVLARAPSSSCNDTGLMCTKPWICLPK